MAALLSAGMFVSCSSDPDYDDTEILNVSDAQLPYSTDGIWMDNNKNQNLNIDDYIFTHSVDENGIVYGFTPSKISDTSLHTPLYSFPYASASGGGITGKGSQYLVGYWPEFLDADCSCPYQHYCTVYPEDGDTFKPESVMVCNTTYMKYAALEGTDYSPKFSVGDYVTLIAHGVHLDGTEQEAVFYLVNIESDNVEDGILMAWDTFDLSGLGACVSVYFTMDCSDNLKGEWGINVPTYFCLDKFILKD